MKPQEEERILLHSNELPRLSLKLQKQVGDFIVDTTELHASGHTIEEAVYALGYLLEEARRLQDRAGLEAGRGK